MNSEAEVIDVIAYREAVLARQRGRPIPLMLAGWTMAVSGAGFAAYVLIKSAEYGVIDGVVAALLAMDALLVVTGLTLVRSSRAIHAWLHTRSWNRTAGSLQALSAVPVISFEAQRRIRSHLGPRDSITCGECGAVYSPPAITCPACDDVLRAA